jgi:asparagine synthase (glutamine-hydrolysing)
MCGIAGLISKKAVSEKCFDDFVTSSTLMNHRGPDYRGVQRYNNVLLIHYRLSIIDLNPRSHQPFESANQSLTTVFNGEVYNFRELAHKNNLALKTSSDTEVVVECFAKNGEKSIDDLNGIFAMAILDKNQNKIHFVRDRFGVKPIYIYEDDDFIAFSSEAKVILNWLESFSINFDFLAQYLWFGNRSGNQCIANNLTLLDPGTIRTFDLHSNSWSNERKYWSLLDVKQQEISEADAINKTRELLDKAVERQLVADAPIGILLSGGVDSSSLVAFGSKHYEGKLDTYSIDYDFNIGGKGELQKAAGIAAKFNTNHHEFKVESKDVKNIFTNLVFQYDEPFADPAMIPLYQLAKACSADKRVILQGDGGDEFFAGYRRYNVMDQFWFWKFASSFYPAIPNARWKERMKRVNFILNQTPSGKLLAYYLSEEVPYKSPYQILNPAYVAALNEVNWSKDYERVAAKYDHLSRVQQLLYVDTEILLPNRYCEKVDKATMYCSIEARVPFLDNDLTSFALSLPSSMKVKRGEKKYILKKALEGLIPNDILYGPKIGFNVPISNWLRNDLYEFARDSFSEHKLGILDTKGLLNVLEIHKAAKADYSSLIWKSLVLCHWFNLYQYKIKQ